MISMKTLNQSLTTDYSPFTSLPAKRFTPRIRPDIMIQEQTPDSRLSTLDS